MSDIQIITTNGVKDAQNVVVKASGWVKYQRDGEIHHLPPHIIKGVYERDPEQPSDNNDYVKSDVTHASPHGRV